MMDATRKRILELACVVALVTAAGAAVAGAAWFDRYRRMVDAKLVAALGRRDYAAARALVRSGAGVHKRGANGITLLMLASAAGDTPFVKTLIARRTDVNATDDTGRAALIYAAEEGEAGVVAVLLDAGAGIDARDRDCGRTPLMHAARNGHTRVVRTLLARGASPNARDNHRSTPIQLAAGYPVIIRELLDRGVAVNTADDTRLTPLFEAIYLPQQESAAMLVAAGADVNARETDERTPLMAAASVGDAAVVRLLLDAGADARARDADGNTAATWATLNGHPHIARLLEEKMSLPVTTADR